jgi:TonB-linked SusC/RagA family outer membrane protein
MKTANWKTGLLSAMVLLLFCLEAYPLDKSFQEITVSEAFERTSPESINESISSLRLVNIKGTVVNEAREPLIGVSIIIKGTDKGTVTDLSGSFSLEQLSEMDVMVFSYIGYLTQEVPVGNRSEFDITLQEDQQSLDEVVVTALGIRKETKALGYSVTKLEGDSFSKGRETNFANALVGKVAGVNVTGVGTGPGGSSRVTIRGNTSISGDNQPLYIINGLPMDNTQFGSPRGANPDWGDNISSINPDDIEEITVLKGATAAALYGSRAKNGAIVITTKTGKGHEGIGVEYTTHNTLEVPYYIWNLQKEYGQGYGGVKPASQQDAANHSQNHWGAPYDNSMTVQLDGVERPYTYVKDQVLDDFYQAGFTSSNNLSFTGGSDNGSFRVGVTNMRNRGIIPNAGIKRNNISLGLSQKATKDLLITANVDYISEAVKNRYVLTGTQGSSGGTILFVNSNMPTSALAPGFNEDYTEKVLGTDLNATNPYFVLNRMSNKTQKDRFIASVTARWNLLDWLFIQGRAGQDFYTFKGDNIIPDGTGFRQNGQIDQRTMNFWERNFEGLIGMDKSLNENFGLAVNLGGNLMSQHRYTTAITGLGFVIPQLHVVNNTSTRNTTTQVYNKKIHSVFGTMELSYKNFLFLNLTGRNDWFSTLSPDSNNYFYPSAGLSFVFSDAVELPQAISLGKLRVAYASVGGDTDPYGLYLTYGLLDYNYNGRPLGTINQQIVPNNMLRPLSVDEYEAGLDLRFFQNRLGFDVAVYNKITTNDIAIESISTTSGYSGVSVNVGSIRNRGVELLLTGKPVEAGNFSWGISANMGYNKSKVLKISNTSNELILATTTKAFIKHIEGEEYSQIVGRTIKRDEQGRDIIDDTGLPVVPTDVVAFGSGIPRWTGGVMNDFRYKAFNLSFLIDGKFGGMIYSDTNYGLDHRGMSPGSLLGRAEGAILPGVTENGEVNQVLVTADRVNNRAIVVRRRDALDDYIYDASFIKLRNVALTYTLPGTVYEKVPFIKGASISLVGRNLQILMKRSPGIDPETNLYAGNSQGIESNALPPTRSYGFNVNVKF